MNIFLTGASGFIGARLTEMLSERGETIHILCRSTSNTKHLISKNIRLFSGDVIDQSSVESAMEGCDRVYHLAAYAKNWSKDYSDYYDPNVLGWRNIMEAARKLSVQKIVFTSSVVTYGTSINGIVTEKTKRASEYYTDYERSKTEADDLTTQYLAKGMNIVTVHPTRVFGPGFLNESNSVTLMIQLYLQGKFRTIPGNGNNIGNYSYIDDVAAGHILAMKNGKSGEHYILGGENLSYNEFFRIVSQVASTKHLLFRVPRFLAHLFASIEEFRARNFNHYPLITPGWIDTFCNDWECSSQKAKDDIGYVITPFSKAVSTTISWLYYQTNQKR